ncbi:hypothetical protein [Nocardia heshunensis]
MKYAAHLTAVVVAALLAGIPSAQADPGDTPRVCTVPTELAHGTVLILYGSTPAVPAAPIGDSMTLVRFPAPGALQYMVVGSGVWQDGTYTYSSPEQGVAVIDSTQTSAPQPIPFTMTLRCRTNDTGQYAYTTPDGAQATDDNVTVYRFTHVNR